MKDKLHVHCAPLKTCRCVLIQPASLVGKQRLNFGKALVVVENCAKPVLHNMHMSHVNIQKFSKPVILYVKVPSTYIYTRIITIIIIYILCHYIYTLDPLWFPVSQLKPFGFLPSFHPVETAHCAVCRKQKWCWKLLTQRKRMYQFMKCRSRRQQCGNVFKDLNLRMSQGVVIFVYIIVNYIYIAWYKLSYHF